MSSLRFSWPCSLAISALLVVVALESVAANEPNDLPARAAAAIERGLPLVEQAAERYPTHRKCFSCHHQTLPMLAVLAARAAERGDKAKADETLRMQAEFARAAFERQLDDLKAGKGVGGRGLTVAYGLWTMKLADAPADEVTAAMITFLLKTQHDDGHWEGQAVRPPMEESLSMCTTLALVGLKHFAAKATAPNSEVDTALAKAQAFLVAHEPKSQEDRNARLWALDLLKADADQLSAARATVLAAQRADGGWSQTDEMASDAYATGQTLTVLAATGSPPTDAVFRRGVEFLLQAQRDDGSWLVETRAKPVQVYFDNGDPHGKSQFIATPASCWALAALAAAAKVAE